MDGSCSESEARGAGTGYATVLRVLVGQHGLSSHRSEDFHALKTWQDGWKHQHSGSPGPFVHYEAEYLQHRVVRSSLLVDGRDGKAAKDTKLLVPEFQRHFLGEPHVPPIDAEA